MLELHTIPGYPRYSITKYGQIFSHISGRFLVSWLTRGYHQVALRPSPGKHVGMFVHRLVAMTFIPNPDSKREVNHINGIKSDNRLENLEWTTPSENTLHSFRVGLSTPSRGMSHVSSKLTDAQVLEIRGLRGAYTYKELGLKFGVHSSSIGSIMRRERWSHI